ncbi:MAG: methyltransferase domain-containing protein [Dehalococcoidia bacterium]|nr:methyltransferase domain-containing protein [Dehalococcoidia bacterium]
MISVVCVYNNESVLKVALLRSLGSQTAKFEPILLDNRDGRYRSAAQALNDGGRRATGDFIMFIHQDMWLATPTWLEDAERLLKTLPDAGVAGVAGMSDRGRNWYDRVKFSISVFGADERAEVGRVHHPTEVQTLDECVLIVPKPVFDRLPFDETTFDGWDSYGIDYCLSAKQLGLKAYVLPLPCSHCCARACYPLWHFGDLFKYEKRLYAKHKRSYKRIYTWMGNISWLDLRLRSLMTVLGPLYVRLFPNIFALLKRELAGCRTVLDLGCGHHSPLQVCNVPFSVGVELFEPSLLESRRVGIHSQYIRGDVARINFQPQSFDAVIAVEVLEHLTKEQGIDFLHRMQEWATKKVVVTTPNGYVPQDTYDHNPLQEHRSGWDVDTLRSLGFHVRGSAGWKALRGHKGHVKHKPAFLWERISDLTQPLVYRFPKLAFQLIAVKRTEKNRT